MGVIKPGTSTFIDNPSSGKSAKVLRNTTRCSFQWLIPATIASRESFAPCMKNNRAIAAVVKCSKKVCQIPSQGNNEANSTTISSTSKNLSIRRRCNQDILQNSLLLMRKKGFRSALNPTVIIDIS
ncbi:hypothetical protein D3C80_1502550 [compost metagenome]